jgi:hypothetical protein
MSIFFNGSYPQFTETKLVYLRSLIYECNRKNALHIIKIQTYES